MRCAFSLTVCDGAFSLSWTRRAFIIVSINFGTYVIIIVVCHSGCCGRRCLNVFASSKMPHQWQWSNSRWSQHGSWRHWHSSPSNTQEEWDAWKADQEAEQRLQALQTYLRQCRGSQALPQDDISALENNIEALKMARTDALPLKERAARVEQQRRSFAGIEKQQAERVAALEEQRRRRETSHAEDQAQHSASTAGNQSRRFLGGRSDGSSVIRTTSFPTNSCTNSRRPLIQNLQ